MRIPYHAKTALVGPSGSGKSTLLSLMMRFYEPTQGDILLSNTSMKKFSFEQLRSMIGFLPQEAMIFSGTVADNILMGKPGASIEEVCDAARLAYAEEFINTLPQGFDTYVGEKGVRLSGGQKQRIALARAILKNPSILLLDEPTSALDAESEHFIQKALSEFLKGRTSLIIAHRLATVMECEKIFVLNQGKLVAEGTHKELLTSCSVYAKYAKLQLKSKTV